MQPALQECPAVIGQVGNLSHDVKKTVTTLCHTGQQTRQCCPTVSEAAETINSPAVTFNERINTIKARYGALWNKMVAYRHRA